MSDLTIIERQVDGVVFVDLDGKILLGESNRQLHDAVRLLVQEGKKNVVLNLESVTRIDSSGLGELIASFATLEKNGGKLKLMKSLMGGGLSNMGMPGGPMIKTKKSGWQAPKDRNKKKRR